MYFNFDSKDLEASAREFARFSSLVVAEQTALQQQLL
jgi:hypothetical protein